MTKGKALVERKWTSSAQTKRLAVDCIMPSLKSRVSASPQDVFLSVMDRLKLVLPMTALSELEFVHPRQHPLAYASKTFSVSAQLCCRCRTRERACSDDDRGTSEASCSSRLHRIYPCLDRPPDKSSADFRGDLCSLCRNYGRAIPARCRRKRPIKLIFKA